MSCKCCRNKTDEEILQHHLICAKLEKNPTIIHAPGFHHLGVMFYEGKGTKKNLDSAIHW